MTWRTRESTLININKFLGLPVSSDFGLCPPALTSYSFYQPAISRHHLVIKQPRNDLCFAACSFFCQFEPPQPRCSMHSWGLTNSKEPLSDVVSEGNSEGVCVCVSDCVCKPLNGKRSLNLHGFLTLNTRTPPKVGKTTLLPAFLGSPIELMWIVESSQASANVSS